MSTLQLLRMACDLDFLSLEKNCRTNPCSYVMEGVESPACGCQAEGCVNPTRFAPPAWSCVTTKENDERVIGQAEHGDQHQDGSLHLNGAQSFGISY